MSRNPIARHDSASASERLAALGSILSDPTRSEILCTLMDGRAYTGTELSSWVGVARSTTSEHLSRLQDAGMVTVQSQGRHRYFRLANPEVAELLEIIGSTAPDPGPPRPQSRSPLAYARTCRHHLAVPLATQILDGCLENGWLVRGKQPRSIQVTLLGQAVLTNRFGL